MKKVKNHIFHHINEKDKEAKVWNIPLGKGGHYHCAHPTSQVWTAQMCSLVTYDPHDLMQSELRSKCRSLASMLSSTQTFWHCLVALMEFRGSKYSPHKEVHAIKLSHLIAVNSHLTTQDVCACLCVCRCHLDPSRRHFLTSTCYKRL